MLQRRRAFIRNLALASAAVALRPTGTIAAVASALRRNPGSPLASLDHAKFAALRGTGFAVGGARARSQTVVLTKVEQYVREPHIENFSLQFEGPADTAFAQGTHRFEHPALGSFDLFVTAQARDERTAGYTAVFNRLV